jgi:hypothetical protein
MLTEGVGTVEVPQKTDGIAWTREDSRESQEEDIGTRLAPLIGRLAHSSQTV